MEDQERFFERGGGFPRVVLVAVSFPFDEVFNFVPDLLVVQDAFDFEEWFACFVVDFNGFLFVDGVVCLFQ